MLSCPLGCPASGRHGKVQEMPHEGANSCCAWGMRVTARCPCRCPSQHGHSVRGAAEKLPGLTASSCCRAGLCPSRSLCLQQQQVCLPYACCCLCTPNCIPGAPTQPVRSAAGHSAGEPWHVGSGRFAPSCVIAACLLAARSTRAFAQMDQSAN